MKAITYSEYGPSDVLQLSEMAKPAPRVGEALVRIRAASVNPIDWHFMRGTPYLVRLLTGWRKPKVTRLGVDAAGQVEAVGGKVTQFRPGDEVFGACRGAFAECGCAREAALALKPANLTFEQAAAVPVAAFTALQGLRDKGRIQPGKKVLINGAAGGVGTFAVQLARCFGADVTGVCSTRNVDLVRSIGAHHVVDYTREDFTKNGVQYDLIFDSVGNHSLSDCRRALVAEGTLVLVGAPDKGPWLGPLTSILGAVALSPFVSQKLRPILARPNQEDWKVLRDFLESGKVTPVIDRTYPLREISEAIRYLEEGHARGKVVIKMAPRSES
ncbi:MAG TPA: NAD(P)-dependent alcohol dehydrogenase [Candidatus Polarisedimenticolia bacterium]|nr:NAD(P)-dependent alcohol dehydrogenase [Candidatus Polarisedimenticolia bacterium]